MAGRVVATQHEAVGQSFDDERRQPRAKVEEPTHQPHTVAGIDRQRLHGLAWLGAGADRVLLVGQPIAQVAQQEHRVAGLQAHSVGLAIEVQPAMPLHHQVETGPAHALGAGVPATAVAADMKQAGIELQAF
ncbi:hypothetical protein D3C76_1283780 [compost metagenome]